MITDDFDEEQSAHIAARIDLVVHVEEDAVLVLLRGLNARHGLTGKPVRSLGVLDLQRSQSWPPSEMGTPDLLRRKSISDAMPVLFTANVVVHRSIDAEGRRDRVLKNLERSEHKVSKRLGATLDFCYRHESVLCDLKIEPFRRPIRDLFSNDSDLGVFGLGFADELLATEPVRLKAARIESTEQDDRGVVFLKPDRHGRRIALGFGDVGRRADDPVP